MQTRKFWFSRCQPKISTRVMNRKEAGNEAKGARGLSKNSSESVSPLSCLIRRFCNKYNLTPPREA